MVEKSIRRLVLKDPRDLEGFGAVAVETPTRTGVPDLVVSDTMSTRWVELKRIRVNVPSIKDQFLYVNWSPEQINFLNTWPTACLTLVSLEIGIRKPHLKEGWAWILHDGTEWEQENPLLVPPLAEGELLKPMHWCLSPYKDPVKVLKGAFQLVGAYETRARSIEKS